MYHIRTQWCGKTSLMKAVTAQFDFLKLINLPPTRGINREGYLFRGLLEVSIWDAGDRRNIWNDISVMANVTAFLQRSESQFL